MTQYWNEKSYCNNVTLRRDSSWDKFVGVELWENMYIDTAKLSSGGILLIYTNND